MNWSEVEPVLQAAYRLLAKSDGVRGEDVIAELGRPPGDEATGRALEALDKAGYIKGQFVMQTSVPVFIEATEKGLQQTSGWPGGSAGQVDLFLRLLDERIADESTPEEEKGRLRNARDSIASLGRDVFVGVLGAYVAHVTGADGG